MFSGSEAAGPMREKVSVKDDKKISRPVKQAEGPGQKKAHG